MKPTKKNAIESKPLTREEFASITETILRRASTMSEEELTGISEAKSEVYEKALKESDDAVATLEKIAGELSGENRKKLDAAVKHVENMRMLASESSIDFNNDWFNYKD